MTKKLQELFELPQDAIDDFLACDLDYLYLNEYEVKKI